MYYDNKNYEQTWPELTYDSQYDKHCKDILDCLSKKDLIFIRSYYFLGLTEDEIAPLIGLTARSSVSDYKRRVFARFRAFSYLKFLKLPKCVIKNLKNESYLETFYKRLFTIKAINLLSEDYGARTLVSGLINQLINFFEKELLHCIGCRNQCKKSQDKTLSGILDLKEYSPVDHINIQIKVLKYLLNWRVFE